MRRQCLQSPHIRQHIDVGENTWRELTTFTFSNPLPRWGECLTTGIYSICQIKSSRVCWNLVRFGYIRVRIIHTICVCIRAFQICSASFLKRLLALVKYTRVCYLAAVTDMTHFPLQLCFLCQMFVLFLFPHWSPWHLYPQNSAY